MSSFQLATINSHHWRATNTVVGKEITQWESLDDPIASFQQEIIVFHFWKAASIVNANKVTKWKSSNDFICILFIFYLMTLLRHNILKRLPMRLTNMIILYIIL